MEILVCFPLQASDTGSEGTHDDQSVFGEHLTGEPDSQEKALDLSVKAKASRSDSKQEIALDLSMSSGRKNKSQKLEQGKQVQKRRRSSQESNIAYSLKFGNYGIAGTPRTKRQLSLHTRKKEEEQERLAKKEMSTEGSDTSRQHSMEDIVHAEMLLSLKTGNEEGSEKSFITSPSKTESTSKGKKSKSSKKKSSKDAKKLDGDDETEKTSIIKAFKCGLCFRKFSNARSLQAHVETHSGTFNYTTLCKTCGQQCESQDSLLQHISNFHAHFMHRCNFCGKYCKTFKKLKNHMWTHISVCGLCGEKFYNAELLETHVQEQHGLDPDKLPFRVERKSDDSDDSADEEDEEMDKESNATTEIAEDSDFDHDKSDGIKAFQTCEENSETLQKDNNACENSTEREGKQTVKDDTDIGSNTTVLDVHSFQNSLKHPNIATLKHGDDGLEMLKHFKATDSEIPVQKYVNEIEVLNTMKSSSYFDKKCAEQKLDSNLGAKVELNIDNKDGKNMVGTSDGRQSDLIDLFEIEDKVKQTKKWLDGIEEGPKPFTNTASEDKVQTLEIIPADRRGACIAGVYREKANQLKEIMGTAKEGNCFVCSKTVPLTVMEAHVKTHSVVTLSRAKDGLKALDIEIPALECPLFLCSFCNAGFDSCQSLVSHVGKHVTMPKSSAIIVAVRKRKREASKDKTEVRVGKIPKSELKTEKPNQAISEVKKSNKTGEKTEGKNSGSILAAYLNAGPLYQSSSLAKMAISRKEVAEKPDLNLPASSNGNSSTGALPHEENQGKQGSNIVNVDIKEEKDKKLLDAQCTAVKPGSAGIVLPVNGKGDGGIQENAKPVPLMLIRDEKSQDLKIVTAPSFLHSSNLKTNQMVKVIPHTLLPAHLGEGTKSSGQINQHTTVTLTSSVENLSQAPLTSTINTASSLSSTPAVLHNIMVAQSLKGGLKISKLKTVPGASSGMKTTSESGGLSQNYSPTVIAAKTLDLISAGSKVACLSNISQVTTASTVLPLPIVTTALPASISHGQNLPLSLQPGQVRLVTPAGTNLSPGQQHITLFQMVHGNIAPTVVKAKQIAIHSSQIKNTEPGLPLSAPTPFTVVSSSLSGQTSNKVLLETVNCTLPQESLLKKTHNISSISLSCPSSVSSSPSPLVSVLKPQTNMMNVMQYIQSQGSLQTSTSAVSEVNSAKYSTSSPPKPTFNLVITQAPLTQTTMSTGPFSSQLGTSGSHQVNAPNIAIIKGTDIDKVDSNYKTSMPVKGAAPVTNRLALICNVCKTEIQNLEMIGQHVCPSTVKQNAPMKSQGYKEGVVFCCVICKQEFPDLEIILAHQRGHKSDNDLICCCKLCSKVFPTERSYGAHMKNCHSNRLLSCPFCLRALPDQKSYIEHLQLAHLTEATCDLCADKNKLYLSVRELTLHKIFEHPFECTVCKYRCDTEKKLWIHILNHPKLSNSSGSSQTHDQGVTCKKCLVGFVSAQAFQSHVRVLHQGESCSSLMEVKPEKCHLCGLSFKQTTVLHEHLEKAHTRKLTYLCSECYYQGESPSQLILHLREHLNNCPLEIEFCHVCCKVFPTKILYTKHISLHEQGSTATVLNVPSPPQLATKTASHTNVNVTTAPSFQPGREGVPLSNSEQTEKSIIKNTSLETESKCQENNKTEAMKQNTTDQGNAQFKCDYCGMEGFQNRFLLNQHRVIRHLQSRTRTPASYYRHIVENIRRLKSSDCMVCGKKFASGVVLKLHMKSHLKTVKTNYVCSHPECRLKFKTKLLRLKHMKTCEHKADSTLQDP